MSIGSSRAVRPFCQRDAFVVFWNSIMLRRFGTSDLRPLAMVTTVPMMSTDESHTVTSVISGGSGLS